MAKSIPATMAAPPRDNASDLSQALEELEKIEVNLALRRQGAATSPDSPLTIAIDIQQQEAGIAAKQTEISIIRERLSIEAKAIAHAEHKAKVDELASILPQRENILQRMDEHIEAVLKLTCALDAIDSVNVSPRLGGCDTYFAINNRSWTEALIRRLARGGIGLDKSIDKSLPVLTLADHARKLHAVMLQELADRPRARADLQARMDEQPDSIARYAEGYKADEQPAGRSAAVEEVYKRSHGGNAENYTANGELKTKLPTRIYTDKLEPSYE